MKNKVLEKPCNKIVVIYETFTKKYYLVKISQSKMGHICLIVREKRGRELGKEKNALHKKIFDVTCGEFH